MTGSPQYLRSGCRCQHSHQFAPNYSRSVDSCADEPYENWASSTTVEHRYGRVNCVPQRIEWLTDNGSCYTARDTRAFARDIGLVPRTTPVSSPQSNGMAEAFARTLKRDYVRVNPRPDARTVIAQLPGWFAHDNEVHPHRALGY